MKYILLILIVIMLSCSSTQEKVYSRLKAVRLGMDRATVDRIMGAPDSTYVDPVDSMFCYFWRGSWSMSGNMYVMFSPLDSTVKRIIDGQ